MSVRWPRYTGSWWVEKWFPCTRRLAVTHTHTREVHLRMRTFLSLMQGDNKCITVADTEEHTTRLHWDMDICKRLGVSPRPPVAASSTSCEGFQVFRGGSTNILFHYSKKYSSDRKVISLSFENSPYDMTRRYRSKAVVCCCLGNSWQCGRCRKSHTCHSSYWWAAGGVRQEVILIASF